MTRLALIALVAASMIAVGCGDDDANGNGSNGADSAMKGEEEMKGEEAMKGEEKMAAGEEKMKSEDAMASESAMTGRGASVSIVDSEFGRVVADGEGEALYLFDKEEGKKSRCYGACAKAWPPMLTKGKPVASMGAKQGLIGTTRRRNGKLQVTYAGHPLYYYVDDSPGTILCHDVVEFGGTWLVVKPSGAPAA